MTEIARLEGIQASLQSMSEFSDAQVVINDYSVLDAGGSGYGNFAILRASDNLLSRQDTRTPQTNYDIPVLIAVPFDNWKDALDAFVTLRQAVLDEFNSTSESNRCADGVHIPEIRTETPIEGIYDAFVDFTADSVPDFLAQQLIFVTEEY